MGPSPRVIATATIFLLFIFFVVEPWGYVATRMACNDSGGTTFTQTYDTNGYLNGATTLNCYDCFDEVALGLFQYVDVFYQRPNDNPVAPTTGYKRFELLTAPDARCDWWYRSSRSQRAKNRYGLDDNQCIGRYPISENEVSRFESHRVFWKPVQGPLGVDLYMHELKVSDRESGKMVARARDYRFVNSLSEALGQKSASYSCPDVHHSIFGINGFRADILKDTNGERHDVRAAVYVPPQLQDPDKLHVEPPAFSEDAVLHAIGVYRAARPPNYRPSYSGLPDSGDIQVNVGGDGKVILVLSAHDPVRWTIQSRGAKIEQVVVFSYHQQRIIGIGESTQVYYNPETSSGHSRIYAYERDEKFLQLDAAVREFTGKPIRNFQGAYDLDRFNVQVGPNAGVTSDVTTIQKWIDEDGVVHYGDRAPDASTNPD